MKRARPYRGKPQCLTFLSRHSVHLLFVPRPEEDGGNRVDKQPVVPSDQAGQVFCTVGFQQQRQNLRRQRELLSLGRAKGQPEA